MFATIIKSTFCELELCDSEFEFKFYDFQFMRIISALRNDICRIKQCRIVFKNECFNIFFPLINNCVRTKLIIIVKFL